ncbi:hypothetical protein ABID08_006108 [Rhizobium binae]|uniref:Transposase n=1 Tax=Rhizobium binae TaxID=1138190 RepID=A0ABV2MQI6_9HYPH
MGRITGGSRNRGPKCALLVYIDDATGKLLHLRFAGSENTFDYRHVTLSASSRSR